MYRFQADRLFDPMTMDLKCTYCSAPVEEDESSGPQQDSRQLLAKFNEQMEKLYDLLKAVENVRLAPSVLEPEPMEISERGREAGAGAGARGPGGPDGQGDWANRHSGGFKTEENQVMINFGDESDAPTEAKKEVPLWMKESTVNRTGADYMDTDVGASSSVPLMDSGAGADDDDEGADVQNDEIMSLLLGHERKTAGSSHDPFGKSTGGSSKSKKPYIPGAGSGSESDKSDESDPEPEATAMARSMGLLDAAAGTSSGGPPPLIPTAAGDSVPGSAVMSDADDDDEEEEEDGDIPTVKVDGEDITMTDVNEEIIAKMTAEEKERYTQIFQDFYSHMYE